MPRLRGPSRPLSPNLLHSRTKRHTQKTGACLPPLSVSPSASGARIASHSIDPSGIYMACSYMHGMAAQHCTQLEASGAALCRAQLARAGPGSLHCTRSTDSEFASLYGLKKASRASTARSVVTRPVSNAVVGRGLHQTPRKSSIYRTKRRAALETEQRRRAEGMGSPPVETETETLWNPSLENLPALKACTLDGPGPRKESRVSSFLPLFAAFHGKERGLDGRIRRSHRGLCPLSCRPGSVSGALNKPA